MLPGHVISRSAVVLTPLMLLSGCGSAPGPGQTARSAASGPYGFELLNRTGETITDCVLHWDGRRIEFGRTQGPNGLSTMGFYAYPFPARARMTWTDDDGSARDAEAPVVCREGRPGEGGYVCCVLLPDDSLKVEAFSEADNADLYGPHHMYRLAAGGGPQYIVATYNATQEALSDLQVFFGAHQVNADPKTDPLSTDLNAGWRFTHGLPYPVTDQVQVAWSAAGKAHHERVDLRSKLPEDLNGVCIVIVIDEPVRVETVPWSRRARWWMDTRP